MSDYGEQGADTDGLAAQVFWLGPDGPACNGELTPLHSHNISDPGHTHTPRIHEMAGRIVDLEARIARKEAANEALVAKLGATMADMRSLQAEALRLSDLLVKAEEEKSREAVVTDSEKAADQMRQDILGGKIDKVGRQVVRDACDKMDAPKTGRDASNDALGNISRRGGVMSGWGR